MPPGRGSGHSKLCLVLAQESFFPPRPQKRWSPPLSHLNPEEMREPKAPLIKEQLPQAQHKTCLLGDLPW